MRENELHPYRPPIRCVRCQQIKPAENFKPRSRRPELRDTHCIPCRAAYQHEHYVANRQRYIDNAGKRRRAATIKRMTVLIAYFSAHPCVDCGETDPNLLEFDHRGDKSFNISQGFRDRPWDEVLAEINKCDVRCGKCHRRRTSVTRGWYRSRVIDGQVKRPSVSEMSPTPEPPGLIPTAPGNSITETIRCSRCQQWKPADLFNWRRKAIGQRDTYCRPCRAAYKQQHYAAHRQRYIDNAEKRRRGIRQERIAYLLAFLESHPCIDCGETDPRVLEFDHRGDKSFAVSHGLQGHAWSRVLAEIDKCDIRCVDCHKQSTARRQGFYRARLLADKTEPAAKPSGTDPSS